VKAARILGDLKELAAAAVPALTTALQDGDLDVRLAAAKGLWGITRTGDVVVSALIDLLKANKAANLEGGEARRRFLQTVMEALSRIQPPATEAVPALTVLARDSNRHVRESALSTLQKIAPAVANRVKVRSEAQA
jgi:HEAT repeat protein